MANYEDVLAFFGKTEVPVSAGQVATETGVDRKEVDKIMAQLKKEEKIISPKRCYWELKK
ncbi:MAG: MarR family transcriptional regulator [Bacillales bacterium]|jgi:predicted regulator of amino acid metabolism with ACT domain|nr:MarR family transcriptional regulator [Bacillales bacterium]